MSVLGLVLALALAPEIRAPQWLNGAPPGDLRGRTVLVEFWTFG